MRVHSLTLFGLFALPGACDVTPGFLLARTFATPNMRVHLGVWGLIPSLFALPGVCDVTPGFFLARTFATPNMGVHLGV